MTPNPEQERVVTLVLCDRTGRVHGALPAYPVEVPWWSDAAAVVAGALTAYGVDVTVLRLLRSPGGELPGGGPVTYLAQAAAMDRLPLGPVPEGLPLDESPQRLPYARPGGPQADLEWADGVLAGHGRRREGRAQQVRTWNLSSVWRLPLSGPPGDAAWLKSVPPFFAHEGPLIRALERLRPDAVPTALGVDGTRTLLAQIPGADLYDAPLPDLLRMVELLVDLQLAHIGHEAELLAMGLPDWRGAAFVASAHDLLDRHAHEVGPQLAVLSSLVDGLAHRLADIAACGMPDTLVHGDFHPGNLRGDERRLVLLDWGDSGVGHPLLDMAAFLGRIPAQDTTAVRSSWLGRWRRSVPGADPERAAELLAPVGALRQAVIYRRFLDGIEPSEHVYHAGDPAAWLRRAAATAG